MLPAAISRANCLPLVINSHTVILKITKEKKNVCGECILFQTKRRTGKVRLGDYSCIGFTIALHAAASHSQGKSPVCFFATARKVEVVSPEASN